MAIAPDYSFSISLRNTPICRDALFFLSVSNIEALSDIASFSVQTLFEKVTDTFVIFDDVDADVEEGF